MKQENIFKVFFILREKKMLVAFIFLCNDFDTLHVQYHLLSFFLNATNFVTCTLVIYYL